MSEACGGRGVRFGGCGRLGYFVWRGLLRASNISRSSLSFSFSHQFGSTGVGRGFLSRRLVKEVEDTGFVFSALAGGGIIGKHEVGPCSFRYGLMSGTHPKLFNRASCLAQICEEDSEGVSSPAAGGCDSCSFCSMILSPE